MAEQSPISIGDEVLIITSEGDSRTGVLSGSNEGTANEKLLYTIKFENSIWVGPTNRVFPKSTTREEAMESLREREEKQSQELVAQQTHREEEERRLAEAAAEAEEPGEQEPTEE